MFFKKEFEAYFEHGFGLRVSFEIFKAKNPLILLKIFSLLKNRFE